ncbi:hypothetical protein BDN71DRAFT_1440039 [Pleurotus eryngii]|uniref:Uncharacterized protein n=1 Tax=Pleurotus eryngii TaxID=5323 RepID=A0A9P6A7X0_PLEER|nr:hypothetical protein BDN71DRAFT_1440039 [Pleurotus eryngii]
MYGVKRFWHLLLSLPRKRCELAVKLFFYANAVSHPTVVNICGFPRAMEPRPNGRRTELFVRRLIRYANDEPLEVTQLQLVDKIFDVRLDVAHPHAPIAPTISSISSGCDVFSVSSVSASPTWTTVWFCSSPFQNLLVLTTAYSAFYQFFQLPACVTRLTVLDFRIMPALWVGTTSFPTIYGCSLILPQHRMDGDSLLR